KILTNTKFSSIHKTKAEGFEGDDFLNLVVAGESDLNFDDLNEKLKDIENESGRKRDVPKFSARTLDIDIVLQINEDEILYESDEIEKYSFVSEPLKEVL
ncbi:MAG: 2-amino-4-hydroxy-6-hydroxymethyldihydropteridine diphosphokinase, partial [Proteobacteria bacterium]|nr:2-amino-4-hydroxy-6-hydroxymethyldihydropteridine diphosphokinase [Pseudomonadota bacterium]